MKNLLLLCLLFTTISCLDGPVNPFWLVSALTNDSDDSTKKKNKKQREPEWRPLEVSQVDDVYFYRRKQMVVRYDCNGHVTSHKLEKVSTNLSKKMTVRYENRKKCWSYSVVNRRTHSRGGTWNKDCGEFTIDLSPHLSRMRVKEGINDVEYVFRRCTKIERDQYGTKKCVGAIEVEKEGILQINVHYQNEILDGTREYRPTPQECGQTIDQ